MGKRWYSKKFVNPHAHLYDATQMLNFLEQNNQEGVYYHVNYNCDTPIGNRCFAVKASTVKKIIENGYTLIDLWVYANKFKNTWKEGKSTAYKIENKDSFVIDLDKTKYSSLEELIEDFKNRKVPLPLYISQTSKNNFHLMYRAEADIWKFYTKLKLCYMIAGINIFPRGETEIRNTLKEHGIDYNYLKQNAIYSKIRVGGSYNTKHCLYKVKSWFNKDYNYYNVIKSIREFVIENNTFYLPKENDRKEELKKDEQKKKVRLYNKYSSKRKLFEKIIDDNFKFKRNKDKSKTNALTDLLIDNMNRLIKKKMYISQSHWGSILNLDQANVSRLLKKLISLEILEVISDDYQYQYEDKKSKVYGFTDKFIEIIYKHGKNSKAKKVQDDILMAPYEDGITNTQIMSDIRILFLDKGYTSTDGIAEFIYSKDLKRPHHKQRGYTAIRKFVASYMISLNERYRENRLEVS